MARILVADDERDFRESTAEALREAGHETFECSTVAEAIAAVKREAFDVILTDLRMPGQSGIELLRRAAEKFPESILIVLTAYGSLEVAIEALRAGADDFMLKPVNLEALLRKIDVLVRHQATLAENRFLRQTVGGDWPAEGLVGSSAPMQEVMSLIHKVASTDSTVLIVGETGTGKELAARAIHQTSARREAPFVPVNCGSIPGTLLESELFGHSKGAFTGADRDKRGLFEVAGSGTIFLDEIGELPLGLQPKILRALENREILRVGGTAPARISARIVAATHRDLREETLRGRFRADLYYRLSVIEIAIPPLRLRPGDIRVTAEHLLGRLCRKMNRSLPLLPPEAWRAMEEYPWPGNVREMANVLERALILNESSRLGVSDLPGLFRTGAPGGSEVPADDLRSAREAFEQAHVRRVVEKHGGDKRKAAQALGINLSSLYRKLEGDTGGGSQNPGRPTELDPANPGNDSTPGG